MALVVFVTTCNIFKRNLIFIFQRQKICTGSNEKEEDSVNLKEKENYKLDVNESINQVSNRIIVIYYKC